MTCCVRAFVAACVAGWLGAPVPRCAVLYCDVLLCVHAMQGQYSKGVEWSWDDVTPSLDVNYLRWENASENSDFPPLPPVRQFPDIHRHSV